MLVCLGAGLASRHALLWASGGHWDLWRALVLSQFS